ncbi:MAG: heme-binding protein [Bryobacteraceae bacterium]
MAQGVISEKNISLGMAKTMAEAALAACRAKGFHTTVAVVDRAGQLLMLMRDEQAAAHTIEMARRKAYTARMFRMATKDFQKRTTPDTLLAGQRQVADALPLAGGIPVQIGDDTIGAIGSSGSSLDDDDACARAGVAKVADLLK